jgi:peptidoglycan/LPS O-acetylase OafA/YrhL
MRRMGPDRRRNNFDILRLTAAIAVLVSHSFVLSGHHEPTIGSLTVGTIAVFVFFAISGFLITRSWEREPRLGAFLAKRILRIFPALIVVVLLTALVAGPLLTSLSGGSYFGAHETWTYVFKNVILFQQYVLPGVFTHNPYGTAVNGSLWTLPTEFRAYLFIALLGVLTLLARRRAVVAILAFVYLLGLVAPAHTSLLFGTLMFYRVFLVGAILYLWRDEIPRSRTAAAGLIIAWVALSGTSAGVAAATVAISYAAIVLAYEKPALTRLTKHGDFSYGIYLWAFPVQQTIAHLWHHVSSLEMIVVSLPSTVLLAIGSWRLVEGPALTLRRRVARTAAPQPAST